MSMQTAIPNLPRSVRDAFLSSKTAIPSTSGNCRTQGPSFFVVETSDSGNCRTQHPGRRYPQTPKGGPDNRNPGLMPLRIKPQRSTQNRREPHGTGKNPKEPYFVRAKILPQIPTKISSNRRLFFNFKGGVLPGSLFWECLAEFAQLLDKAAGGHGPTIFVDENGHPTTRQIRWGIKSYAIWR